MPSLLDFRAAIATSMKAEFGTIFKTIDVHSGRFTEKSIKNLSVRLPALYVACLGWPQPDLSIAREINAPVRFVCFLITEEGRRAKADQDILDLADKVTAFISNNRFGQECLMPLAPPSADNLVNADILKKQINIWALSWQQPISFGNDLGSVLGDDPDGTNAGDLWPDGGVDNG